MDPNRTAPADIAAVIDRRVITRHDPAVVVYDGEVPHADASRVMLRIGRDGTRLSCPAREVAPADEATLRDKTDPVVKARVSAINRGPQSNLPAHRRWGALLDGVRIGAGHATKRDAIREGITALAVEEWWAARDAAATTQQGAA